MLHLAPDRVLPLSEAGEGSGRSFSLEGLKKGWIWAPRNWIQVTSDTGIGSPASASAEKGAAFFDALTKTLAGFIVELAGADLDALYE